MRETEADLARLQDLLDSSYEAAGTHLRRIITPERRLDAKQVAEHLGGMKLLALATVTAGGRPQVGPVDGIFMRGSFHFGSAPDSAGHETSPTGPTSAPPTSPARSWR